MPKIKIWNKESDYWLWPQKEELSQQRKKLAGKQIKLQEFGLENPIKYNEN